MAQRRKNLVHFNADAALEGRRWTLAQRLQNLAGLYDFYRFVSPIAATPLAKTFSSWKEYRVWQRQQKNPWYR